MTADKTTMLDGSTLAAADVDRVKPSRPFVTGELLDIEYACASRAEQPRRRWRNR
jgi:hypothetical protein